MKKLIILLAIFYACNPAVVPDEKVMMYRSEGQIVDLSPTFYDCTNYADAIPNIPEGAKYINPGEFKNWSELMKGANYFVMAPGDYRKFGPIRLKGAKGLTFRAMGPGSNENLILPPEMRGEDDKVLIESFDFRQCENVSLIGLNIDGNSVQREGVTGGPTSKAVDCKGLFLSDLHFRNVAGIAVLRALDISFCTFQNNLFEGTIHIPGKDTGGFQIAATLSGGSDSNKVVSNHFVNLTDAFSFGKTERKNYQGAPKPIDPSGYVCGTLVRGNRFEINDKVYNGDGTAKAENLIDLKGGCDTDEGMNLFTNNSYTGSRPTSGGGTGSTGEAIVLQRAAQYITFRDELIYDCAAAFTFQPTNKNYPNEPGSGNVTIENVIIAKIPTIIKAPEGKNPVNGVAFRTHPKVENVTISDVLIMDCPLLVSGKMSDSFNLECLAQW